MATPATRNATSENVTGLHGRIDAAITAALAEKRLVGGVVIVSRHGELLFRQAFGDADREAGHPVTGDTLFRFSSVTKPFVAITALRLVERGTIGLDDPVTRWLPDFTPALPTGEPATIRLRHLLTHTAGLTYRFNEPEDGPYAAADVSDGLDLPGRTLADNLARIRSIPLGFAPGTAWQYSVALDVLGAVIEQATGQTLPDVVHDLVLAPLGIERTGFAVIDPSTLATPYVNDGPEPHRMREVETVPLWPDAAGVRFVLARAFDPASFPSGGAGMVGAAPDVHVLLEAIRMDAADGSSRLLARETAQALFQTQIGELEMEPGKGFGFAGAVVTDPALAGTPQSACTLSWGGVYGHSWFIDPAAGITAVILTNTAYEGMLGQVTIDIRDAIYAHR